MPLRLAHGGYFLTVYPEPEYATNNNPKLVHGNKTVNLLHNQTKSGKESTDRFGLNSDTHIHNHQRKYGIKRQGISIVDR